MAKVLKFILLTVVIFSCSIVFAQKPKPVTAKTVQKFTPPKITSALGIRSDTASVYREEAIQLVTLPLKVTDAKKNVYTISSYQFMYKRRGVTEVRIGQGFAGYEHGLRPF